MYLDALFINCYEANYAKYRVNKATCIFDRLANYPIPFVAKGTVGVTMVRQIKAIRLEQTRRIFRALRISDLNSFMVRSVVEKKFLTR